MSSKFLHIVIPRLKNIVLPATSFPSIPQQEMRFTVFKHLNATPAFNDDSQENSILWSFSSSHISFKSHYHKIGTSCVTKTWS